VRAVVPLLAERLAGLDPAGAHEYRANAAAFTERLDSLHAELGRRLAPARSRSVFLSHPVLCYFLNRYEIRLAGVIEWVEGREPTAKDVRSAIERASSERAAAVLAPPELSRRAAEIVAEAAGIEVRLVDPLGETAGPGTYEKLLLAIADTIASGTK
jgi:zinc transport system substrate-binding protein